MSRLSLAHRTVQLPGCGTATDYARALLESLGAQVTASDGAEDVGPGIAWASSGLMSLTGLAGGRSQMCPAPLASCADGVIKALASIAPGDGATHLPPGRALLGERAAIAGLQRNGSISPGGGCRLLKASDGWLAISLNRDADWSDVPAWLEEEHVRSWDDIAMAVASREAEPLVGRARLLGLAACVSVLPAPAPAPWCSATRHGPSVLRAPRPGTPNVVDLSSLWAGPLCTHVLQRLGARVIKVESPARPDGARTGPSPFFDLLNQGKRCVALPFDARGIDPLRELLDWADIVVEASRPRGLRQLGILAEEWVAQRNGRTWISISGYGREEPGGSWAAYGDDGAVAAGLSALMQQMTGLPLFCGDAIADPLTGLHAALAALASHQSGGGHLVSLALRDVVAHCISFSHPQDDVALRERWQSWDHEARANGLDSIPPVARAALGRARPLGADTVSALAGWGNSC